MFKKNKEPQLTVENIGKLLAVNGKHIIALSEVRSETGKPVYEIFLGDPGTDENNQYITLTGNEMNELKSMLNKKDDWTEE
ncbi:MAG: hypothetical protein IJL89_03035 [Firmicutes bacterium]|nr:hypothetical protein [Bacillota bacterium]